MENVENEFPQEWEIKGLILVVNRARVEEAEDLFDFLKIHFLSVSPNVHLINYDKSVDEPEEEKVARDALFLNFIQECLSAPYSLTVREKGTGRLVAVRINKMEDRSAEPQDEGTPHQLIFAIFDELKKSKDLFALYNTNRIMRLCMVAVTKEYARQGLATRLTQLSVDLAIKGGAGAIRLDTVNSYSARIVAKLGFSNIRTIDYATFEFNGARPLAKNAELLAEHSVARLMARRLP